MTFEIMAVTNRNDVKFKYSEKATKFCKIFSLHLTSTTKDKSKVEISQIFLAFLDFLYEL